MDEETAGCLQIAPQKEDCYDEDVKNRLFVKVAGSDLFHRQPTKCSSGKIHFSWLLFSCASINMVKKAMTLEQ